MSSVSTDARPRSLRGPCSTRPHWPPRSEIATRKRVYTLTGRTQSFGVQSGFPADAVITTDLLITYTSSLNPLLTAGTEYFLVGTAGDSTASSVWRDNSLGIVGDWSKSGNNAWAERDFLTGAVRIVAIPEPSSFGLIALVTCCAYGWLRVNSHQGAA